MLAVALHLLTGRYGATEYNDRSRPEWPPHPARLFSALVAAWADADEPDPDERAALAWLECRPAPELVCSDWNEVLRRDAVTVYVPGNDPSALRAAVDTKHEELMTASAAMSTSGDAKAEKSLRRAETAYRDALRKAATATGIESTSVIASTLEVLPDNRNRQPRTFPSVTPSDSIVRFVWRDAVPTEAQRQSLDRLLARVARLGHSATLVSCHLETQPPEDATLVPRAGGEHSLRVPRAGLVDRLEHEFDRHQGTKERLLPAAMVGYGPPEPMRSIPPVGNLSGDWFLLEISTRDPDTKQLRALRNTRSLELARAVRDALLAHAEPGTGIVSGLWPDGTHRAHLAVAPLASVGHRWADGTIRGVAVILPVTVTPSDRAIVEQAVAHWRSEGLTVRLPGSTWPLGVSFDAARLVPAEPINSTDMLWADQPMALRRSTWCRSSRHWVSVSPVALDRVVPGLREGRDGAELAAQESLARSCARTGLPEPTRVVIGPAGMTAAVPDAPGRGSRRRTFPRFVAAGTGQRKQCVHAALTFPEPVRGPVLIGAGRYLGYGLFLPAKEDGR
jgi:CRISPR-associated protein Csb2